jgi:hypothetical protein
MKKVRRREEIVAIPPRRIQSILFEERNHS